MILIESHKKKPENILKKYPETFVYFSDGVRVQGDFHFRDEEIGQWIAAFK